MASVPGFTRLLWSSVLGRLPSGMFSLAILLLVRERTGSFLVAGVAVGAFTLVGALMSPVQGAAVDRYGQTRVLVGSALAQGALLSMFVLVVAGGAPAIAIVAMAALAGSILPPVSGCVRALWPEAAPDAETLEAAYALDAVTQEIVYTLGPLLAGAVATLLSPSASVLLCAIVTVAGTLFFAASPLSRGWRGSMHKRSRGGALASPGVRILLLTAVFGGIVVGAAEVGLPALAVHLGSRGSAGVLLALFSVGSMLGGLLYSARSWLVSVGSRYMAILLGVEISVAPLIAVDSLPAALVFAAIAGLGVAPMLSCQFSLVGALAPPGATTEAFTWHRAATVGGIAGGSALGGVLIGVAGGVSAAFALGCTGAALAVVLAVLGRRSIDPSLAGAPRVSAPMSLSRTPVS
ncbi:MAG: MFS transporter [Solirubrobacteraceae bacterium]